MSGCASAAPLGPVSDRELEWRMVGVHAELSTRGFTDEQIRVIRAGEQAAHQTITDYLAAGGSRYGEDDQPKKSDGL